MLTHTGERPYKCGLCNFSSTTSSALKVHLIRHAGEKRHQCNQCNYSTVQAAVLRNHKLSKHSRDRPYKCPICDLSFATAASVKSHEKSQHVRYFKCDQCLSTYGYQSELRKHVSVTHSVNDEDEVWCFLQKCPAIKKWNRGNKLDIHYIDTS